MSLSLNPEGASRSELSIWSTTSPKFRAPRDEVPAKITSSIPSPRIALARFSPMTQRSASSRFDLPQPFGPTTPVSPSLMIKSVGSTKLLKPFSLRRLKRKAEACSGFGVRFCIRPLFPGQGQRVNRGALDMGYVSRLIHKILGALLVLTSAARSPTREGRRAKGSMTQ
jgi:hypothetical protein